MKRGEASVAATRALIPASLGALLALLLAALSPAGALAERPERIVSMNLCADQLLMLLAERPRIASVSFLAAEPRASAMAEAAEGLHLNHGLAEQILPLEPDLVIAGTFTTRPTVALLRKLGYRIVELPVASDLDDVRGNIRLVAEAIGAPERGEALIAGFDRRLAALRQSAEGGPPEVRPLAALYWANGLTSGGGTLAAAMTQAAGLRNLAVELGLAGTWQLPLETLLTAEPSLLVMGRIREHAALANETFRHPALQRGFAQRPQMRIADRYWICGTPFVASAIESLVALRQESPGMAPAGKRPAR